MKLTRRGFLAGAGAVAAGSAAWGLDPNRAWADEEVAEEPAGTVSLTGILQYDAAGDGRYILKLRDENDCTH